MCIYLSIYAHVHTRIYTSKVIYIYVYTYMCIYTWIYHIQKKKVSRVCECGWHTLPFFFDTFFNYLGHIWDVFLFWLLRCKCTAPQHPATHRNIFIPISLEYLGLSPHNSRSFSTMSVFFNTLFHLFSHISRLPQCFSTAVSTTYVSEDIIRFIRSRNSRSFSTI